MKPVTALAPDAVPHVEREEPTSYETLDNGVCIRYAFVNGTCDEHMQFIERTGRHIIEQNARFKRPPSAVTVNVTFIKQRVAKGADLTKLQPRNEPAKPAKPRTGAVKKLLSGMSLEDLRALGLEKS